MNLTEFAEFMGVAPRTVKRAVREGMPAKKTAQGRYKVDPEKAREWWLARKGDKLDDKVVDLRGKALREEYLAEREGIRLAKDRAQVLDATEVADCVQAMLTMLRQGLMALPDKAAKRLGMDRKGRAVLEELVSAELHQAADRLSVIDNYENIAAE